MTIPQVAARPQRRPCTSLTSLLVPYAAASVDAGFTASLAVSVTPVEVRFVATRTPLPAWDASLGLRNRSGGREQ
jgi:hypothetical protein